MLLLSACSGKLAHSFRACSSRLLSRGSRRFAWFTTLSRLECASVHVEKHCLQCSFSLHHFHFVDLTSWLSRFTLMNFHQSRLAGLASSFGELFGGRQCRKILCLMRRMRIRKKFPRSGVHSFIFSNKLVLTTLRIKIEHIMTYYHQANCLELSQRL